MKKNKTLKVACGLLVMVLLTTCVISTTLARYTTSDTASDTARVAKWGLEVSTSGTLFGNAYKDEIVAYDSAANKLTVQSSNKADVVAPGTKNSTGFQIKLAGTPEVDYNIVASYKNVEDIFIKAGKYATVVEAFGINANTDFAAENLYTKTDDTTYTRATAYAAGTKYFRLDPVTVNANNNGSYYPIVWTGKLVQDNDPAKTYTTTYKSLDAAVQGLKSYINNNSTSGSNYDANHKIDDVYTLTWSWDYQTGNDAADTLLGNLIVNNKSVVKIGDGTATTLTDGTDYHLVVGCEITVTATQVD